MIGQEEKPFTITIEPPNRINARNRNIVFECLPHPMRAIISKLTQHVVGLVEQ